MDIPLDEVLFFDAVTSTPATGAAVDADAAPTFAVYEESTDTDIGIGGNMTKRTSLTGNYRGTFTASAANGFEVGKWYSIIGSAVVGGVTGKAVLKNFRVVLAEAVVGEPKVDLGAIGGVAQSATDLKDFADDGYDPATNKVQGVVLADTVTTYTGNTLQTGDSFARLGAAGAGLSAIPWNATWDAEVQSECADALVSYDGLVPADLPANFAALGINASGHVSRVVLTDTLTTYTGNTLQTGNVATLITTVGTAGAGLTDLGGMSATMKTQVQTEAEDAIVARIGATGSSLTSLAQASICTEGRLAELDAANLPADVAGVQTDTDNIQTRIPAALVGGRMDASAGALAANVITTAAIADGAITDAKITVPAEITGLATGVLGMLRQLWQRWFYKATLTSTELKTFKANASDVATTQVVSDTGGVQTQGPAS